MDPEELRESYAKDDFPQSVIKNEPGRNGVPRATECITCATPLPEKGEEGYHPQRKYCVACGAPSDAKKGKKTKSSTRTKVGPSGDAPAPKSVTNNFTIKPATGKTRLGSEIAAVQEGATYMLGFAPMIMAALGDTVCPEALSAAIPDIARQLAVLSKYHPFIRKIFVSGEGTGEFMAWIGLLITISPVLVTILAHHELISGKVGDRIAQAAAYGGAFADVVKANDDVTAGE